MPPAERLAVWLHGKQVGSLERDRDGEIRYVPARDATLSVAASGLATWSPELTQNWFDGLLPEEGRRARLAARLGVRNEDTFGLLAQVGWECAGAVAVLADGVSPTAGRYEPIPDQLVGDQLDGLPSLAGIPDAEMRMSLGGAQEKLLLARVGDSWAVPLEGAPSTHILKPEPEQWPGLASAEAWALVARNSGRRCDRIACPRQPARADRYPLRQTAARRYGHEAAPGRPVSGARPAARSEVRAGSSKARVPLVSATRQHPARTSGGPAG
jgi:serine/threonine-protein kinase HipA